VTGGAADPDRATAAFQGGATHRLRRRAARSRSGVGVRLADGPGMSAASTVSRFAPPATGLTALVLAAACATPAPKLASLPGWEPVRAGDAAAAYHHEGGGTIAASSTCGPADDVPLDVLTNHLLFGVEHKQERSRVPFTLAGRAALRTRLDGTLDGVPVSLDVVVLKKDGCTHDLMLIAPRSASALREPDFDRFVSGWAPEDAR
jgi:hypothetical protein